MQYYAIQNRQTKRFVADTDFDRLIPRQILSSPSRPPLLFSGEELSIELKRRHIKLKDYKIVIVELRKVEL